MEINHCFGDKMGVTSDALLTEIHIDAELPHSHILINETRSIFAGAKNLNGGDDIASLGRGVEL